MGYLYINFWTTWNWETRILVGWVGLGLGPSFMWGDMIYISDYQFCIFETRLWFCLNIECSLWKQKHNDIELNRIYSLNIEQNNFIRIQNRMLFKFLSFFPSPVVLIWWPWKLITCSTHPPAAPQGFGDEKQRDRLVAFQTWMPQLTVIKDHEISLLNL